MHVRRMDRELRRVTRILLRDAHAAGVSPEEREELLTEAYGALKERTREGPVVLDVTADARAAGLDGVAALVLSAELDWDALRALVGALDPAAAAGGDAVLRLGDRDLDGVTLTLDLAPAPELEAAIAAPLAGTGAEPPPEASDVAPALSEVLGALEASSMGPMALRMAVTRPGDGMLGPAFAVAGVCDEGERARIAALVAHQLAEDTRRPGASALDRLRALLDERVARLASHDAQDVEAMTGEALVELALRALLEDTGATTQALAGVMPEARLIEAVIARRPSDARDAALRALAEAGALTELAQTRLGSLDPRASEAVLEGLRHAPADDDAMAVFRSALRSERPQLRARGLSWLSHQAPRGSVEELAESLRGDDRGLRLGALRALLGGHPSGAELVRQWWESPELANRDLDTRRLATLALAELDGEAALPALRKRARATAFRRKAREGRAAAIAGLGALGDAESWPFLRTLAKKSGGSDAVANEAARVMEAVDAGRAPYDAPLELIERDLGQLGLLASLRASEPPGAPQPSEPQPSEAPAPAPITLPKPSPPPASTRPPSAEPLDSPPAAAEAALSEPPAAAPSARPAHDRTPMALAATLPAGHEDEPLEVPMISSSKLRPPRAPRVESVAAVRAAAPAEARPVAAEELEDVAPPPDLEDEAELEATSPGARALSPGFRAPTRVEESERPSSRPAPPEPPSEPAPAPRSPLLKRVPKRPGAADAASPPGDPDEPRGGPDLEALLRDYVTGGGDD